MRTQPESTITDKYNYSGSVNIVEYSPHFVLANIIHLMYGPEGNSNSNFRVCGQNPQVVFCAVVYYAVQGGSYF